MKDSLVFFFLFFVLLFIKFIEDFKFFSRFINRKWIESSGSQFSQLNIVKIWITKYKCFKHKYNMRFLIRLQGYKVYYTMNPNQPEASWDSQMVDNSELTTISELTPLAIYTVRVQAFTSMGAGPMSNPVKVKTQQGPYKRISLFSFSFSFSPVCLSVCLCVENVHANNHSTNLNDNN